MLKAPAIHCMHCVGAIKRAVSAMEGVSNVEGDSGTKMVRVTFDPSRVKLDAIKATMAEEGYPVAS